MPTDVVHLLALNVLIVLSWPWHVHHGRVHAWLDRSRGLPWATTPRTETGYLRLSTNAAVVGCPVSMSEALGALRVMRSLPGHTCLPDASTPAEPRLASRGSSRAARSPTST